MKIIDLIHRLPVASYFLMVYIIAWGGCILGVGAKFMDGIELELNDALPIVIFMLGAPSLVGLAWTYICDGKQGLRDLFSRMKKWKVPGRWYATLLIFPVLILIVLILLSLLVTPDLSPTFFSFGILMGLLAGFLEEIGWMGFAYPKMRMRLSFLRAGIYLGLIHALWHSIAYFLSSYNSFGGNWLPYFTGFFVFLVALRIIIAWVYENTGSVLLTQLMHASSTGFLAILVPSINSNETWPIFYAVYAIGLWLVAGFIIMRNEKKLVNQPA
ncbi:MAG: CPBP family intramembrane glutamic endopeptidase [Anaerolineales bacterium]